MKRGFIGYLTKNLTAVLFALSAISAAFGAVDVDRSFNAALINKPAVLAGASVVQPDNKVIVFGDFNSVDGKATFTLVRLNSDGTLDPTFNAPSFEPLRGGDGYSVKTLALQSNGKVLVGGTFNRVGGEVAWALVRLNTDGSRDTTFPFYPTGTNGITNVEEIRVLPDDTIIFVNGSIFYRLFSDGTLAGGCGGNGARRVRVQPDGKVIIASFAGIRRCNESGGIDNSFQNISIQGALYDIDLQPDGKIVFAGNFSTVNGFSAPKIMRANADGTIDTAFSNNLPGTTGASDILVLPDGKILVNGNITGSSNQGLNKLNSDGSLDTSFVTTGNNFGYYLNVLLDGRIIRTTINTIDPRLVTRINANGSPDNTFQTDFGIRGIGYAVFPQADGKILAGGDFAFANNISKNRVARFNADGSVDSGFTVDFTLAANEYVKAFDVQPNGKIIAGLSSSTVDSRRLNPDGTTDVVFANTKNNYDVKVLSNGKILIAGSNYLRQFNGDGTLDTAFNVVTNGRVESIAVQADGKILIGGNFTQVNSTARGFIARLNADGTLDSTFNSSTGANFTVFDVALQTDGKIIIGGDFTGYNFVNRRYLARLNTDGTLDTGFVPTINTAVRHVKLQPDNKIIISGEFTTVNNQDRERLARLNQDGTTDPQFVVNGGINEGIGSVELQSDGRILLGGGFSRVGNAPRLGIARLLATFVPLRTLFDFDGDRKADISVFRPSENQWYILRSSDLTVTRFFFAIAGDVPVPADYDGDGRTDLAVFRPSRGDWLYRSSFNNSIITIHWGASGDIPRPSDFDGDGKTDFIVYRPSENNWYRLSLGNTFSVINFGSANDKPLIGDFDGDGKVDPAIFRPGSGEWWYAASSANNQFRVVRWGANNDIPVPGDYDGDGKTDFVVFRPSDGGWYILYTTGSYTIATFGTVGDKPVAADYDGDGRTDIGVFRPSSGTWYLLQTTSGFGAAQFGNSSDIPTENAFLP